jgi:nucleolar protein 56
MYSITTWFGIFLYKDSKLFDSVLFPQDAKQLSEIIIRLRNNEILDEEKKIIKNSTLVCEPRLSSIGTYKPLDPFFDEHSMSSEQFGFSIDLLQEAMVIVSSHLVLEDLKKTDYQIVQMINSIDECIKMSNLLQERLDYWLFFPSDKKDVKPVMDLIDQVENTMHELENKVNDEMTRLAPNTSEVIGPILAARLLSVAGTMHRLACFPASSIQILGAEKAFFRFRKEGGNPPKHGIIFQHPLINTASRRIRGRIARRLAATIMLAARADVFTKRDISDDLKESLSEDIKQIKKNQ